MKLGNLSLSERRTVPIGASIVLASGLFVRGFKPYATSLGGAKERLRLERETLAREQTTVAQARADPLLQQRADSAMALTTPRLFSGRDDVMASADLVAYLGDMSRRARVLLQDATTRPSSTTASGVRTLRVDIRAESDLQGILTLLQTLEWGDKLIRVERIDLSRLPNAADDDKTETLSLSATIAGFALPAESLRTDDTGRTSGATAPIAGRKEGTP